MPPVNVERLRISGLEALPPQARFSRTLNMRTDKSPWDRPEPAEYLGSSPRRARYSFHDFAFLGPTLGFALLLMLGAGMAGQPILRVEVRLVSAGVQVTDNKGREIEGLTAKDFKLYDNDIAQKIAFFSNEELPISLEILFDRSSSMSYGNKLDRAREAASSLVRSSHPQTEFLYIPFDDGISPAEDFLQDRGMIESQIQKTVLGGGTSLYDAIIEGLNRCAKARQPRQTVVVISDGADENSVHTLDQVIQRLYESQVQFYAIGYFEPWQYNLFKSAEQGFYTLEGKLVDNPRFVLQHLAKKSGGEAYFPESDEDLGRAIEKISKDLRPRYTLAFYPPDGAREGEYHHIKVKLDRPGLRVRARAGYTYSSPSPNPHPTETRDH